MTGAFSTANGIDATVTGVGAVSNANGANATATTVAVALSPIGLFGISVALGRTEPVVLLATALKSMKVMFATPCYISAVSMNYVASIFSLTCDAVHLGRV